MSVSNELHDAMKRADQAFEVAAIFYPGDSKYRARPDHRTIRVFILDGA